MPCILTSLYSLKNQEISLFKYPKHATIYFTVETKLCTFCCGTNRQKFSNAFCSESSIGYFSKDTTHLFLYVETNKENFIFFM